MRDFTSDQLALYDGDAGRPVYIAVKGEIYDVTSGASFYGKGGPYEIFAGRECARALAKMAVDAAECNDDLSGLTERQLKTLEDWIKKFKEKYPVIGRLSAGITA